MSERCPGMMEYAGNLSTLRCVRAHSTRQSELQERPAGPPRYLRHPGALKRPIHPAYQRRKPEETALHGIVRRNLNACLAQAQERSQHGFGYPAFVEREFEKFLDCGQLRRGFVRVKCAECPNEKLVAFSCKGRGFCPSCTARRMSNTAAHLVDTVLPALPYRQWVLSFPRRVRFLLASDHDLLSAVLAMALRKIFSWQKRAARRLGIHDPMCGAIGFVQRFGSLVNLNCHFHNVLADGVFVQEGEGGIDFRPIPPPWREDMERLVRQIARGTEKLIARRAERYSDDEGPELLVEEQAQDLGTRASVSDCWPQTPDHKSQRQAFFYGYSLHAERIVNSDDREGLEKLCRYASRAPIANSRLSLTDDGHALLKLKRPLRDGRKELRFGQLQLLQKLAILIPPPHKNLTRYFGVFAPGHRHRAAVVGMGRQPCALGQEPADLGTRPPRNRALPWAELLRRVFAMDILKCDLCGGDMKIIAIIPASEATEAILDHLGIDTCQDRATGPPADSSAA